MKTYTRQQLQTMPAKELADLLLRINEKILDEDFTEDEIPTIKLIKQIGEQRWQEVEFAAGNGNFWLQ